VRTILSHLLDDRAGEFRVVEKSANGDRWRRETRSVLPINQPRLLVAGRGGVSTVDRAQPPIATT
jgi:hypothetical protein